MLGLKIEELRKQRELTQAELGKILGFKDSTISQYETNKREPDYKTLQKLADFFSVSVDYLLGRTNNPLMNIEEIFNKISKEKNVPENIKNEALNRIEQAHRELQSKESECISLHDKIDQLPEDKRKLLETITDSFLRETMPPGDDEQSAAGESYLFAPGAKEMVKGTWK